MKTLSIIRSISFSIALVAFGFLTGSVTASAQDKGNGPVIQENSIAAMGTLASLMNESMSSNQQVDQEKTVDEFQTSFPTTSLKGTLERPNADYVYSLTEDEITACMANNTMSVQEIRYSGGVILEIKPGQATGANTELTVR